MSAKKNFSWRRNGTTSVTIKTIHGSFQFVQQRLLDRAGTEVRIELMEAMGSCNMSPSLRELCVYYSMKLSFQDAATVIAQIAGAALVSDQKVWELVMLEAAALSQKQLESVSINRAPAMPQVSEHTDVYSSESEVLVYADAILVTRQKENRTPVSDGEAQPSG